jgi:hypothetical protein
MSKFKFKDNRPLREKVKDFLQSLLFWRGRRTGAIHTRNIEWDDIRAVLVERGYPQDEINRYGDNFYVRYFEQEADNEEQ